MIGLSPEAQAQIDRLIVYYESKNRIEASTNLLKSLDRARARIALSPAAGLPAPRPYPSLKRPGRLWITEGAYWIAYTATEPPIISGVFFVTSDIPTRFEQFR